MDLREIDESMVIDVIETGQIKVKPKKNKFWVYKNGRGRRDNLVSVSISIETPRLIAITTMMNWSPT